MLKIELANKTYVEVFVYGLYLVALAILVKLAYDSVLSHAAVLVSVIVVLSTLRIVPVLPLKRHKKSGQIAVENERIHISHHRTKKTYDVAHMRNLNIKLAGYDGQPMYRHMNYLRPKDMDKKRLMNGLGNYMSFKDRMNNYKFELYFDKKEEYEEFKNVISIWKDKYPNVKMNIER